MNSIEALKSDFHSQIAELKNIDNRKISDNCIYVGSGDSYVAGLFTEYFTDHQCRCYSPSDLSNSRLTRDWTYCFVSVTGKTRANIAAAERASQAGAKTVAITFNENSKLAQVCDNIIHPKIERANTPTAGFGSFVANVVTCLQVAGITVPKKFDVWYKNAVKLSQNVLESMILPDDTLFVLGNNTLYPLALYASLQMAEFFGTTAVSHKLEEFCHSPIFGLKKTHHVWILGQKEEFVPTRMSKLVGRQISYFELYNEDIVSQIFESIFFVQNLILLMAEKHGYTELTYVTMKDVLRVSSDIIYFNEAI
jgi:glutamine---fructose-6-phosphate transaminase (isomerizing)